MTMQMRITGEPVALRNLALPGLGQSDMLCSVALIINDRFERAAEMIAAAQSFLDARFRFWEVLVFIPDRARAEHPGQLDRLSACRDVRILVVRDDLEPYRIMPIAASESIGDFVVFLLDEEFELVELEKVWEAASASGRSVLLHGRPVRLFDRVGSRILSRLVGFDTDPAMLRSCAHFRQRITWLLQRSDRLLAFRFSKLWSRTGDTSLTLKVEGARRQAPLSRTLVQRLLVAADLTSHAAPRLLKWLAVASLAGVAGSVAMIVYALALLLFVGHLAEGWFSTTIVISTSTGFICSALGCLGLGLARLLEKQQDQASDGILQQISNTDCFRQADILNVLLPRA